MGRIVVEGPLASFADGLRGYLAVGGYALDTVRDHVHLLAELSDWLSARDMTVGDLTESVAEEFLRARRATGLRIGVTERALAPTLRYLRSLQAVPQPSSRAPVTFQEVALEQYRRHLAGERGATEGTIKHSLPVQAAYLHREIPAAVIVVHRQTRARHASLTSRCRIHTAASPADLHTSLCHRSHLHPYGVRRQTRQLELGLDQG